MVQLSDLTKPFYRTGEIAKMIGRSTRVVQNYCIRGELVDQVQPNGKRLIAKEDAVAFFKHLGLLVENDPRVDALYARVSTAKQKQRGDLDRQIAYISQAIVTKTPKDLRIFSEVGGGLNDHRRELGKLMKMVSERKIDRIFILYRDRLTRFGFGYLEQFCTAFGTKIEIISDEESDKSAEDELAEDLVSIIHSFSGKLYGLREKVRKKINKVLDEKEGVESG